MESLDALKRMPDQEIQRWLRKLSAEDLALALVGADEGVKTAVFRNMSARARSLLAADVTNFEGRELPEEARLRAAHTILKFL